MSRMNGELLQDYQARRAFAIEVRIATAAKNAEYELKRRNGIPFPVAAVEVSCPCAARPYPHFHPEEDRCRQRFRFAHGQPVAPEEFERCKERK